MRRPIEAGDLVRYNAAGNRNKTLGLVYEVVVWQNTGSEPKRSLLIDWIISDGVLPKASGYYYYKGLTSPFWDPKSVGPYWFDDEPWLEIVK
tara:strand:+ start:186 stop:461 length:276 start_codon:yes stop_codon:yes gene_type:complete